MGPCNIKDSAQAWNDGVEAFKKAFILSGGKTTEAIDFALSEINKSNPDLNFDPQSFVDPLVSSLKESGVIEKSYRYKPKTSKQKIDKIIEKMQGLNPREKKEFGRKVFSSLEKGDMLNDEKVKNLYAEAMGLPATDENLDAQIKATAKALQKTKDVENRIQKKIKEMQALKDEGKFDEKQNEAFAKEFETLGEERVKAQNTSMRESAKFANMLQEKRFWLHQLVDYMPLNLMNPNSLMKNISGTIVDGFVRLMGSSIASPVSQVVSVFTKINSNPIGARAAGLKRAKLRQKASLAWSHGVTDFNNELPRPGNLSVSDRWKRAMQDNGLFKFRGILSAGLKIFPNLISKGLTVPDALAFEMVKTAELNRIAEAKKLSGAEKEAFMLDPDEKSMEVATKLAQKATFKQEFKGLDDLANSNKRLISILARAAKGVASYDPGEVARDLIVKGNMSPLAANLMTGVTGVLIKSTLPFIKTPVNMMRVASKILLPEYQLAQDMVKAYKETDSVEKQRLIVDGVTRAVVSAHIRYVALQMVALGLISAGYSDEDKKTKDIVEQELGGPNRINYSAFLRGLTFRDMKKKKGDNIVDLNSLGALGLVLGAYAHAYGKYGSEDIKNRTYYNRSLMNALSVPWDAAASSMASTMDFTFFSGINRTQGAILNKEGYEADKYIAETIASMFTGIVPSTIQKLSTQATPEVKQQFDNDLKLHENIANTLGYRFAFQSKGLKDKYFSLSKEGEAKKMKRTMFFDNYMGRVLEAEFDFIKHTKALPDTDPVSRLYQASRDLPKEERDKLFPASVSDEVSVPTRKGGRKKSVKVGLNEEQHGYLQERASTYRMMESTPFIMSKDFESADATTRVETLRKYYTDGLKMAKEDLVRRYPDIAKTGKLETANPKDTKKLYKKYKNRKN